LHPNQLSLPLYISSGRPHGPSTPQWPKPTSSGAKEEASMLSICKVEHRNAMLFELLWFPAMATACEMDHTVGRVFLCRFSVWQLSGNNCTWRRPEEKGRLAKKRTL